ncbi:hypothetical protein HNY73_005356 [Argiope bruennichi]|uniref:MATH domain-containing protein n=1 Tax=Argiope bruennichi TaxID=94029 RepID=A0A8T0FNG4_ARGBR|nr:hypothetical protein HNY73_005356 [Argiope bruennichi]
MTDRKPFIITWRIKNFSFCWHKEEEEISCPEFNIKGIDGSKWKLYLFPRASKSKMSWSIACYLHLEKENGPRRVKIAYELSALGCDGLPLETETCTDCFMQENDWSLPLILQQKTVFLEKRDEFLPKDTLTIRCRIWQINQGNITAERYIATTRIEIEKVPLFGIVRKTRSRKNVENKYRVEFLQESTETPVFINIKCINGSPYAEIHPKGHELKFCKCKMNFTNDSGMEVLEAEDAFLFRLDLIPLYEKMPVWMFPLLPTSKNENYYPQYGLEMNNLALRCEIAYSTGIMSEKFKNNHLDASTCCDALKAADQYQDGDLKKAAQNYILDHEGENIGSHKWQDLERFTEVIEEVLHLKRMKT